VHGRPRDFFQIGVVVDLSGGKAGVKFQFLKSKEKENNISNKNVIGKYSFSNPGVLGPTSPLPDTHSASALFFVPF